MEIAPQATILHLPKEIIAQIFGHLSPTQKNRLMKVCRFFCVCIKNRELMLKANPFTISTWDKEKDMFRYTYANNVGMMNFLLENGVEANCKNILSMTPFHIASNNGNKEAMQL